MIWIAIALMTGFAAMCLLWPLARSRNDLSSSEASTQFYQEQLAELEQDRGRGLLAADEFSAASAEAARRLITSHEANAGNHSQFTANRRLASLVALIAVPALALGAYTQIGKPDLPDRPLLARLNAPPGKIEMIAAVAKIEKHLATKPQDAMGWRVIAPVYMLMKRFDDAVRAWTNVVKLEGPKASSLASLGEAHVYAANGKVSPAARAIFEQALKIEPGNNQALFFSGMAAEQAGDLQRARALWTRLIATAPAGAPWAETIRERLAATGRAIPEAREKSQATDSVPQGPASEAGKAIAALPPEQQKAAIHSMVAGLATRLKLNGKDLNGWLMLIGAYGVLKQDKLAADALKQAQENFVGNSDALRQLNEKARGAGLKVMQ
ncbi:MAG: c-type cytochrome biogenesis protein CcmI [Beijerinckiaceae bacterium]|nr:c-type cytochrome biogenesis protein CcmI [Beijerinckiaceae bacterium]